ncbi:hypothetical protein Syun_009194 [Stephania yunnanensis]|uniref:Uncharacterized protein n=1 Tax=Stephania yunnanensis TaxID=152371 RepID=A0AAP0KGP4_9MAGN
MECTMLDDLRPTRENWVVRYKIHLMVKDTTGITTFVLFNKQAENLLDTSANKLISSKRHLYCYANDMVSSNVHKFTFIKSDEESCEGIGNKKEKSYLIMFFIFNALAIVWLFFGTKLRINIVQIYSISNLSPQLYFKFSNYNHMTPTWHIKTVKEQVNHATIPMLNPKDQIRKHIPEAEAKDRLYLFTGHRQNHQEGKMPNNHSLSTLAEIREKKQEIFTIYSISIGVALKRVGYIITSDEPQKCNSVYNASRGMDLQRFAPLCPQLYFKFSNYNHGTPTWHIKTVKVNLWEELIESERDLETECEEKGEAIRRPMMCSLLGDLGGAQLVTEELNLSRRSPACRGGAQLVAEEPSPKE